MRKKFVWERGDVEIIHELKIGKKKTESELAKALKEKVVRIRKYSKK